MSEQNISETPKTPEKNLVDYVREINVQLKEMQHYARSNAEKLSTQWLNFSEGELKNSFFETKLGEALNKQGAWVEELGQLIADLEVEANRIENEGL